VISVDQAIQTILSQVCVLGAERVDILSSLGRVLAEDIRAPFNVPPSDNSAMDGFAVRHADIRQAAPEHPARLTIIGDLPAGYIAKQAIGPGQALRIMTGAPVPPGADTVIMQEETRLSGTAVDILSAAPPGANIRRAGEDLRHGSLLFQAGMRLRPGHIGVLASIKRARVSVYQQPRVAILSTGDELIDIDGELIAGKIVTSNSYSLSALVTQNSGIPIMLGIARDTKEDLARRLREALVADIIVTSGGVSVGDYDFVKDVLAQLGADMKFWKVAMRPGQPLAFGLLQGKPAFGLPGNPVSAMVSFEQFVKPAMRKMGGQTDLFGTTVQAIAEEQLSTRPGKRYFIRCMVTYRDGRYYARPTGEQGSGILMSMALAQGLMIIPEDQERVQSGDIVRVQLLDQECACSSKPVDTASGRATPDK
jgi:molybdopterin molybdotransferase